MPIENSIASLQCNKLAIYWFKNAMIALALAALYSIILIMSNSSVLSHLFPNMEFSSSVLVVHDNLSVLVWLISITASILSYHFHSSFGIVYVSLAFCGTVLIALSPICAKNLPAIDSYIPMLENIIFILGISLFGISILLFAINILYAWLINKNQSHSFKLMQFTICASSIMLILIWICFVQSYCQLQAIIKLIPINIELYYGLLFYSGGHLLQFLYMQILILVWAILYTSWIGKELKFQKFYLLLAYLNFVLSLSSIVGHFLYDIIDSKFTSYYVNHAKYGKIIAPILSLLLMSYEIFKEKTLDRTFIKASLIGSSILFLFEGLIVTFIFDMNVTIPAYYYRPTLGINIAFMGFAYLLCNIKTDKTIVFSLVIYIITIGQILSILDLLFTTNYRIFSKVFATKLTIQLLIELIGTAGRLMFVLICGKRLFLKNRMII